jgi:large subunit ribosomal protein L24
MMSSKQPKKQRLRLYSAPLHARHKHFGARLSDDLRKEYKCNTLPVRKGDKVKIMRGDFKGVEGDVAEVDLKRYRIFVTGATIAKADGTQVMRPIHPSNVIITKLKSDKERDKILKRRARVGKEGAK